VSDPPRFDDYRRLNEPRFRRSYESQRGIFVAEGPTVVDRIASRTPGLVLSVLVDERRPDRAPASVDAPVHALSAGDIERIVGFPFHRGVLAVCARPPMVAVDDVASLGAVAVLEGINDHENLGAIIRAAAGLGVSGILLDPTTADPWYRRSVRVSMGTIVDVQFARSSDWPADIDRLRSGGMRLVAASPTAETDVRTLGPVPRALIAVGAEGPGLSDHVLSKADLRVRIPMVAGVDSLNVGQAAAILFDRLVADPS